MIKFGHQFWQLKVNTAFEYVAFHKVSLQYIINMFLDSPQQGLYACMIQYDIKNIKAWLFD